MSENLTLQLCGSVSWSGKSLGKQKCLQPGLGNWAWAANIADTPAAMARPREKVPPDSRRRDLLAFSYSLSMRCSKSVERLRRCLRARRLAFLRASGLMVRLSFCLIGFVLMVLTNVFSGCAALFAPRRARAVSPLGSVRLDLKRSGALGAQDALALVVFEASTRWKFSLS